MRQESEGSLSYTSSRRNTGIIQHRYFTAILLSRSQAREGSRQRQLDVAIILKEENSKEMWCLGKALSTLK